LVFIGDRDKLRCKLPTEHRCRFNNNDASAIGCRRFGSSNASEAASKNKDITCIKVGIGSSRCYMYDTPPFDVQNTGELVRRGWRGDIHI
jgi:hypothetical protein